MSRETPHPGELGRPSYGGDCPVCGGPYEGKLPAHLRNDCPDTGGPR